jgi:hypothetical protein
VNGVGFQFNLKARLTMRESSSNRNNDKEKDKDSSVLSSAASEEPLTEAELAEKQRQEEYTAYLLRWAGTRLVPCLVDPRLARVK